MDLQKIIGQLCIFGFAGSHIPHHIAQYLREWDLGGIILFKRNIESNAQLIELNTQLKQLAGKRDLILSVDHEGGRVFRLPPPFTVTPPLKNVGDQIRATGNVKLAYERGVLLAQELKSVGFNLNYAPVADVNSNPTNPIIGDRAFSDHPDEVGPWCVEFLRGMEVAGVAGCIKHFPGHGDTTQDSHLTLPTVDKSLEQLWDTELKPFQYIINNYDVPFVMTAHVKFSALDAVNPATLSPHILTGILREQMNYQGIILSDDFEMKGIAAYYDIPQAVEQFFRAGGDAILVCHDEIVQAATMEHLIKIAQQDNAFLELLYAKAARMRETSAKWFRAK